MKKKNIVILSTMYYPDMSAPSACIDKYIQELKDIYNFHIITKTFIYGIKDNGNKILYISNWMHNLTIWCNSNIESSKKNLFSRTCLVFINIYKLIKNQFAYPFFNNWEIQEYYNKIEDLSKELNIDTIISVPNTWTCQFAALKYKKRHPDVNWISFILDPFSEFYIYYKYKLFKSYWRRRNLRNECLIYNTSDYLLFSDEMYKYATKAFGLSTQKAFNMGFALDDIRKGEIPSLIKNDGSAKLIYAGMFYQKIRNPEFMLSVISKVKNVKLDLFVGKGECESILDSYISDKIVRTDFAERARYERMICDEYDILINVGNISTLQAPSKMLELLSTGRPILNFYFEKDSQYKMIEKYPLGLNIGYKEEEAVHKVEVFCQNMRGKCLTFEEVLTLFPEHALDKKVSFFKSLIED